MKSNKLLIVMVLLLAFGLISCTGRTAEAGIKTEAPELQDVLQNCCDTWAKNHNADGIVSADIESCLTDSLLMDGAMNFKAAANAKISCRVAVDAESFDASNENTAKLYESFRNTLRENDVLKRVSEAELVFRDAAGKPVAFSGSLGPDFDRVTSSGSTDIFASQTDEGEVTARTLAYELCAVMNRHYFSNGELLYPEGNLTIKHLGSQTGEYFTYGELWMKRFGVRDGELFIEIINYIDCLDADIHEDFLNDLSTLGERICDSLKGNDGALEWMKSCGAESIHIEISVLWDTDLSSSCLSAVE